MTSPHTDRPARARLDYELIGSFVPDGAKVLDVGCGDGQLLDDLIRRKGCEGRGIDIDEKAVLECVKRGLPVYHGDMLEGMSFYPDGHFDVAILSQTLQQTVRPAAVIREMLRVADRAVISFPNFGHWGVRLRLLLEGRMPRTRLLPDDWYDTPNVHLCTVRDFREFCRRENLCKTREIFLTPGYRPIGRWLANWRAGLAIFQIRRCEEPCTWEGEGG
ncbi:MAG TPA: methionine biosynthesis protein MetW [Phycisphaerae bacterium]|nr:methionine biosynthesis protein MetW [Phycisphaerae bacterium]